MLQHGEEVRIRRGLADEWCSRIGREAVQLLPPIAALVDQQRREVLDRMVRIRHAELRVAATAISSDHNEGRLRTQDRHEANGVSDVRTVRKRACLCGMRLSELLLTRDHRLFGRNAERGYGANLVAHGRRKVNEICG